MEGSSRRLRGYAYWKFSLTSGSSLWHRWCGDASWKERVCDPAIRSFQDSVDPLPKSSLPYVSAATAANHRDRTNRASSPCGLTWSNQPIRMPLYLIQVIFDQSASSDLRNDSTLTRQKEKEEGKKWETCFSRKMESPSLVPLSTD